MSTVDISGIDKARLLMGLYNRSHQQGMGFMHARGARQMTLEEAQKELDHNPDAYFDYLHGRVMKVSLKGDALSTFGYNRDVGEGAAEAVVASLRA